MTDPLIGLIFVDVAKLDLEAHVPKITSFWETILLGAQTYRGGAFRPHAAIHMRVGLRPGHFERWLAMWHAPSTSSSTGRGRRLAKAHATRVANAFLHACSRCPCRASRSPARTGARSSRSSSTARSTPDAAAAGVRFPALSGARTAVTVGRCAFS